MTVATTRPETMLGDTAVAVHPEDERYSHLIGRTVELPLTGREIPVIADDYVDREFGTGVVKITPAHDFNDYDMGKRHGLPMINIFDDDAAINDQAPAPYRGLDRFEARKRVVADMEALGLLAKVDDHTLRVPRGDRSGVVIEPYLTDQWYVDAREMAKPAIAAVENGAIQFVPKQWENTYFAWMRDIQDWCISRQLWWGHRIPAWYDEAGNFYVGASEAEVRADNKLADSVMPAPGRGRAGHLVLLRPVDLFHPGLARGNAGAGNLPPDLGAGYRLRYYLLLGRPDDHDDPAFSQ